MSKPHQRSLPAHAIARHFSEGGRGCGKVGFPSKRIAEGRRNAIGFLEPAYKCKQCGKWHVTSKGRRA